MPETWNLRRRLTLSGREIAYDVLGYGQPLILVHGTPSRSYIWRDVAMRLADRFTLYVYDLLGFGQSECREGLDVSISGQSRLLTELIEAWRLEAPSIAGHDIGGAIALRAHLLEGVPLGCIALVDSVVLRPWMTPTTRHVKAHLEVYGTMPAKVFEAIVASHLGTATHRPMDNGAFATYLEGWRGISGRSSTCRKTPNSMRTTPPSSSLYYRPSTCPSGSSGASHASCSPPPSPNVCMRPSRTQTS
jgi:pimeloyl-ACP methyl ester carboxylesterase